LRDKQLSDDAYWATLFLLKNFPTVYFKNTIFRTNDAIIFERAYSPNAYDGDEMARLREELDEEWSSSDTRDFYVIPEKYWKNTDNEIISIAELGLTLDDFKKTVHKLSVHEIGDEYDERHYSVERMPFDGTIVCFHSENCGKFYQEIFDGEVIRLESEDQARIEVTLDLINYFGFADDDWMQKYYKEARNSSRPKLNQEDSNDNQNNLDSDVEYMGGPISDPKSIPEGFPRAFLRRIEILTNSVGAARYNPNVIEFPDNEYTQMARKAIHEVFNDEREMTESFVNVLQKVFLKCGFDNNEHFEAWLGQKLWNEDQIPFEDLLVIRDKVGDLPVDPSVPVPTDEFKAAFHWLTAPLLNVDDIKIPLDVFDHVSKQIDPIGDFVDSILESEAVKFIDKDKKARDELLQMIFETISERDLLIDLMLGIETNAEILEEDYNLSLDDLCRNYNLSKNTPKIIKLVKDTDVKGLIDLVGEKSTKGGFLSRFIVDKEQENENKKILLQTLLTLAAALNSIYDELSEAESDEEE